MLSTWAVPDDSSRAPHMLTAQSVCQIRAFTSNCKIKGTSPSPISCNELLLTAHFKIAMGQIPGRPAGDKAMCAGLLQQDLELLFLGQRVVPVLWNANATVGWWALTCARLACGYSSLSASLFHFLDWILLFVLRNSSLSLTISGFHSILGEWGQTNWRQGICLLGSFTPGPHPPPGPGGPIPVPPPVG